MRTTQMQYLRCTISFLPWILPVCLLFGLAGCSGLQESQEISLQSMRVSGPLTEAPVRVTDHAVPWEIHFTPGVTVYGRVPLEGRVSLNEYEDAAAASGESKNFRWNTPKASIGLDGDIIVSPHVAITSGVRVSIASRSHTGWTVGVGFFREDTIHAIRLDFGIHRTTYTYDGLTLVTLDVNGSRTSTTYHDIGVSGAIGTYFGLTYNTRAEQWPVNFFLNASFSHQPLVDYTPHTSLYPPTFTVTDRRASVSQWLFSVAPGIYLRAMPGTRLLVGTRILNSLDIENQSPELMVLPFAQLDIGF